MSKTIASIALGALLAAAPAAAQDTPEAAGPAGRILSSLPEGNLRALLRDVLERNPEIAAARARARAAGHRAPQMGALPDPTAAVTAFLQNPESRAGPQELMVSLAQRFPWFGKLRLREQAALYAAAAAEADLEAVRLKLLTEGRRLSYELGFLAELEGVLRADRATLDRYEELARARYAAGVGLEQGVVKLQAEITKDDTRLLEVENRRATLAAALNALRDLPREAPLPELGLPAYPRPSLDAADLRQRALAARPEIAAAEARIAEAESQARLAGKEYRPDVSLGLTYTAVGERQDPAGRAMPPPDDGDDAFGITAGINLPIWRRKLAAGVEEAVERQGAARESKRAVAAGIEQSLGELLHRIPLTWEELRLFEDVLAAQAEESLRSAEAGYSAGTLNALDLLDAERVLLEVRTAAARTRADYAISWARLEAAVAAPVPSTPTP